MKNLPVILAIDTSTEACSAALLYHDEIISEFTISQREHTQRILPMIDKLLVDSGCGLSQLDAIAFGCGPGSFTGIRISIAVAQGLALGADKPMIAVSTLMALAQGSYRLDHHAQNIISAIDARMNEVYLGQYQFISEGEWREIIPEQVCKPDEVNYIIQYKQSEKNYCSGTGWQTYPDMLLEASLTQIVLPDAQDIIAIAKHKWQIKEVVAVEEATPTYLRNEVTWKKLPGR